MLVSLFCLELVIPVSFRMRRPQNAPTVEAINSDDEQSFQDEAPPPTPQHRRRGRPRAAAP